VYITHDPVFTQYGDSSLLMQHEAGIPLCGEPTVKGSPVKDDGEREFQAGHKGLAQDIVPAPID